MEPTVLYYDNQSCIRLSENPVFHDCSKHIDIQYHFLIRKVQKGAMPLEHVPSNLQVANILMMRLEKGKFEMLREKLGLVENTFLAKRDC
jgi:hypothetical protein